MRTILSIIFITIFSVANAQTVLTVDDAVKIALAKNYGILMARNDAEVTRINNAIGGAGMLPSVSLSGSGGYAISDQKQTALDGTVKKYNGTTTQSLSTGVELNWTLFDGGKMFVTKQKLSEIQSLGELQLKDQVLQTQYDVISAYYNVVKQKQQLASINEIIKYNAERVKILQTSFNAGLASKNNLLQAKIDLNVYKENAISQQYNINTAKKSLSLILGVSSDTVYEVADSIPSGELINKSEMVQKLFDVNTNVLSSQKQVDIAKLTLNEYRKSRYPIINFSAGYSITKRDYTNWTSKQSITLGPEFMGTISIPLYQAGRINRQVNTQKLEVETMKYNLENVKQKVSTDLSNAITEYEYQQNMLEIERENNLLTKENLEISIQRLKQGETTTLEVHQAQDDYMQSCTRLVNFKYNLKIAELKLRQLLSTL